ncbi:MAG: hypothetical protein GKS03_15405 [Alphaproteobacteria bacterium]|nr:hypothetical protein [Alphaproteobacteria bacterium]
MPPASLRSSKLFTNSRRTSLTSSPSRRDLKYGTFRELVPDPEATLSNAEKIKKHDHACAAFWAFWNALPKTDHVPHLSDYLDNVPPDLQPNVVIMDLRSVDDMSIRLMGTTITEAVGEMTGLSANPLYSGQSRLAAIGQAWQATQHPCGYVAKRTLRSKRGQLIISGGVVLPVRTDTPGSKSVVSYNEIPPASAGLASDDQIEIVQEFSENEWLDIGAGIPE